MVKKVIYRNSIEKNIKYTLHNLLKKHYNRVPTSILTTWLNKYYSKDYLLNIKVNLNILLEYVSGGIKKVLSGLISYEGSVNLVLRLVCNFLNLVKRNVPILNIKYTYKYYIIGIYIKNIHKIEKCVFNPYLSYISVSRLKND